MFAKRGALFANRIDAGRRLASKLEHLRGHDLVVLGLPRGGVPVAAEVARALGAPLDLIVVRKLGVPFQPEVAMGAIGEDGARVISHDLIASAGITKQDVALVEQRERAELERRALRFRRDRPRLSLRGRIAVVVDDGIATGSTAQAACQVARAHGASRVVLAVPVAPPDWTLRLADAADEFVCVETPEQFRAVGQFYADFSPTTDDEVVDCLDRPATPSPGSTEAFVSSADGWAGPAEVDDEVRIPSGGRILSGHLTVPAGASGIVLFAHGSGSSRHSPRNRFVASVIRGARLGTLLFDLLTAEEESDRANVFDVELLAHRLTDATGWLHSLPGYADVGIGYFGASTGAAAALWAAADSANRISAVVSRGGRPDLAGPRLTAVTAPTLLIVGSLDGVVLDLNRQAQARLRCLTQLAVVPGATHLFEEPGTLRQAAELARGWFVHHLAQHSSSGDLLLTEQQLPRT